VLYFNKKTGRADQHAGPLVLHCLAASFSLSQQASPDSLADLLFDKSLGMLGRSSGIGQRFYLALPLVPILPKRTVTVLPFWAISQNLAEFPRRTRNSVSWLFHWFWFDLFRNG